MAPREPHPEILVAGSVVDIEPRRAFLTPEERDAGAEQAIIGHELLLMTRTSFLTVRTKADAALPKIGDFVIVTAELNRWRMKDDRTNEFKSGVTITASAFLDAAHVDAYRSQLSGAVSAK